MRVIKNYEARCAIELARTETAVSLLTLQSDPTFTGIVLRSYPLEWTEPLGDGAFAPRTFDRYWLPVERDGEPYPVVEAVRRFLQPALGIPNQFSPEAVDALVALLPEGDIHLFCPLNGFMGRFETRGDALSVAATYVAVTPMLVSSEEDLKALSEYDLRVVLDAIGFTMAIPARLNAGFIKEVWSMTKKAQKKKAAAAAKPATAKVKTVGVKREDGPVANARRIFEATPGGGKDTKAIKAACEKAGINPGTTSVQLGKWRKEKGIKVERAVKAKVAAAKPAAKKKATKPAVVAKPLPAAAKKPTPKKKKTKAVASPASSDPIASEADQAATTLEDPASTPAGVAEDNLASD